MFLGGADAGGWEEYFDYIFPEDEGAKPNLKLLAMAKMWKKKKEDEPEPETETSTPEKEIKEESDTGKFCRDSTNLENKKILRQNFCKVLTFWKGHKNLKQSPIWFDIY